MRSLAGTRAREGGTGGRKFSKFKLVRGGYALPSPAMKNSRVFVVVMAALLGALLISMRRCVPERATLASLPPHTVDAKFAGVLCNCSSLEADAAARAVRNMQMEAPPAALPVICPSPKAAAQALRCPVQVCPQCEIPECPEMPPPCPEPLHPLADTVRKPAPPPEIQEYFAPEPTDERAIVRPSHIPSRNHISVFLAMCCHFG